LTTAERQLLRNRVDEARDAHRGDGTKLQFFGTAFNHLPGRERQRTLALFLYRTASGRGRQVEELWI